MKRLLRVSFDTALLSFIPILSWFLLSIIVDKNLINVFTITYPMQFITCLFKSVFSIGSNISKEKDKDKYAVGNGIFLTIILGFVVYGFIIINVDNYIKFMNMNVSTYRLFTIYSLMQFYIQLIYSTIIEKLYYEEKNKLANIYSFSFNILNFTVLILSALLFKNSMIIISLTLTSILIFTIYLVIKERGKINFKFNIKKWIRYDSVNFLHNLCFLIIFLFGLSNATSYGEEYTLAISFVALITDTQWDVFDSINTVAKIDIAKGKFNYRESKKNAYKLLMLLLFSVFVMFLIFYHNYKLNLVITLILLGTEIFNYLIYPVYSLKTTYLNLEYSPTKITINKIVANIGRMLLSLLRTPYCTAIGQVASSFYQFVVLNIIGKKHKNNSLNK